MDQNIIDLIIDELAKDTDKSNSYTLPNEDNTYNLPIEENKRRIN